MRVLLSKKTAHHGLPFHTGNATVKPGFSCWPGLLKKRVWKRRLPGPSLTPGLVLAGLLRWVRFPRGSWRGLDPRSLPASPGPVRGGTRHLGTGLLVSSPLCHRSTLDRSCGGCALCGGVALVLRQDPYPWVNACCHLPQIGPPTPQPLIVPMPCHPSPCQPPALA